MRSVWQFSKVKERDQPVAASAQRPDRLRRTAIATTARLLLAAGAVTAPFALIAIGQGALVPAIVVTIGLAASFLSLTFIRRTQFDQAVAAQIFGILLAGAVLTVANPRVVDFGLALALLAPVLSGLVATGRLKSRTWAGLGLVVGIAVLSSVLGVSWFEGWPGETSLVGTVAFGVVGIAVALASNRLNSAFEVYERAQINAYQHLIEHIQDAVIRFSAEGEVLFASRSSEQLFGCRRFQLTDSGLLERIHVLDRPLYLTAFSDANNGTSLRTVEVRMRRDDPEGATGVPEFVWVEASLSPVLEENMPDGRHEVVALFKDITERKDYESEMRQARLAAEDASSAKSRFLATIGHELRTPLNAIVGFSEMMTSGIGGTLAPQHREYAELIHGSGHHLLDVVRMLLDMSKIEAGKFELQAEPFSPDILIAPCLQMVDSLARQKKVTIRTDLRSNLPMVVADERACRQILINLLSNAIKFSNENGTVSVSMWRQGTQLNISVHDNGVGMSAEAVSRIGEPFFQAQDGLSRKYEGTGLGLSIVKGLVDLHDGKLVVASEPGRGTTMTVLLPLNGPAIKVEETAKVTQLRREPVAPHVSEWPEEKRKAL